MLPMLVEENCYLNILYKETKIRHNNQCRGQDGLNGQGLIMTKESTTPYTHSRMAISVTLHCVLTYSN